jgi:hypothetical protein
MHKTLAEMDLGMLSKISGGGDPPDPKTPEMPPPAPQPFHPATPPEYEPSPTEDPAMPREPT